MDPNQAKEMIKRLGITSEKPNFWGGFRVAFGDSWQRFGLITTSLSLFLLAVRIGHIKVVQVFSLLHQFYAGLSHYFYSATFSWLKFDAPHSLREAWTLYCLAFAAYIVVVLLGYGPFQSTQRNIDVIGNSAWIVHGQVVLKDTNNEQVRGNNLLKALQVTMIPDVITKLNQVVEVQIPPRGTEVPHYSLSFSIPEFGEKTIDLQHLPNEAEAGSYIRSLCARYFRKVKCARCRVELGGGSRKAAPILRLTSCSQTVSVFGPLDSLLSIWSRHPD